MLLPHGYEGQGPEHSSARLERFLQMCAEHNIQVCIPTTPSQVFHMLRRQVIRPLRKPLIVMTPKSLLRHPEAVSSLEEISEGAFQTVVPETDDYIKPADEEDCVLCSGKIYYDLRSNTSRKRLSRMLPSSVLNSFIRSRKTYCMKSSSLTRIMTKSYGARKNPRIWAHGIHASTISRT